MQKTTATAAVNKILLSYKIGSSAVVRRIVQMGLGKILVDLNIFRTKFRQKNNKIWPQLETNFVQI